LKALVRKKQGRDHETGSKDIGQGSEASVEGAVIPGEDGLHNEEKAPEKCQDRMKVSEGVDVVGQPREIFWPEGGG
jgi:hypothetical protein